MHVGTFPVVALMVGTAVQKYSCDEMSTDDRNSTNDDESNSTMAMACDADPVDIAVTLSLLVGIFMVSVIILYSKKHRLDKTMVTCWQSPSFSPSNLLISICHC